MQMLRLLLEPVGKVLPPFEPLKEPRLDVVEEVVPLLLDAIGPAPDLDQGGGQPQLVVLSIGAAGVGDSQLTGIEQSPAEVNTDHAARGPVGLGPALLVGEHQAESPALS